jgi:hypothetical protein
MVGDMSDGGSRVADLTEVRRASHCSELLRVGEVTRHRHDVDGSTVMH